MPERDDPEVKRLAEPPRRKPYRAPKLERLGTLTELTAAVGNRGKNDHGGHIIVGNKTT